MCYGSNCNYEIMLGENAGECRRPPGKPCPDMIEDEEPADFTDMDTVAALLGYRMEGTD